jgi:FAD/FMN-containing dehydrogenase
VWGGEAVDPVAAVAVPRSDVGALLQRLAPVAHVATVLPAVGVAEVRLGASTSASDLLALRAWAALRGGHVTLRRATPALAGVAWPGVADDDVAVDLMRSLKRALDPYGTLAPGRHLAGI